MPKSIIGLILLLPLLFASARPAAASPTKLSLKTGTSQVLRAHGIGRVAIGDSAIIGALPLPGKTQLLINAKAAGRTTLIVWTGPGATVEHDYEITVTADNLELLAQMLRATIDRPDVQVQTFDHSILIRGSVPDGAALQGVADVLARFDPVIKQDGATIVNGVVLAHPLGDLQRDIAAGPAMAKVRVDLDGQGNVIVSGRVKDEAERQAALKTVRGEAGRFLAAKGEVIDRLALDRVNQINIKVRVVEIDDTGLSQLGTRLQGAVETIDASGKPSLTFTAPNFPLVESRTKQTPFQLGPFFRTALLAPTVDLLVQTGHAKVLSEPNLTTIPGQEATFLVGGQIPVPQGAGLGQISVVYQNFGVQLNVNPVILGSGDISTKITPEISDIDFQDGIVVNGFSIPALKVSKISTNVITAPGQSIVMGGMLRRVEQRTIEKIPLLSQLPILGRLFQDVRYQRGETNIIFVMTPQVLTQ